MPVDAGIKAEKPVVIVSLVDPAVSSRFPLAAKTW